MAEEKAAFEVLDDLINDQNSLVTYKTLSRIQTIHVNDAKKFLASYVKRCKSGGDSNLNVIYCLTGLRTVEERQQSHVFLVPDHKLEEIKGSLTTVTTCHIYSVQKTKLKDSNALFIVDFDKDKNAANLNRYSGVQHRTAKYQQSGTKQSVSKATKSESDVKTKVTKVEESETVEKKSTIPDKTVKAENGSTKSDNKSKNQAKGKGGKKPSKQNSLAFKPMAKKMDASPEPKGRKTPRASDDSGDEIQSRKRCKVKLIESSSEEEDDQPESPVPSPPVPDVRMEEDDEPKPKPDPDSDVQIEEPMETDSKTKESPPKLKTSEEKNSEKADNNNDGSKKKKRVRKRKLVPKTFMDDEGFMVTEKVWESDSTDASDTEEVKPKAKPPPPPAAKPKQPAKTEKGKKTAGTSGTKQASLMNFFSKK